MSRNPMKPRGERMIYSWWYWNSTRNYYNAKNKTTTTSTPNVSLAWGRDAHRLCTPFHNSNGTMMMQWGVKMKRKKVGCPLPHWGGCGHVEGYIFNVTCLGGMYHLWTIVLYGPFCFRIFYFHNNYSIYEDPTNLTIGSIENCRAKLRQATHTNINNYLVISWCFP